VDDDDDDEVEEDVEEDEDDDVIGMRCSITPLSTECRSKTLKDGYGNENRVDDSCEGKRESHVSSPINTIFFFKE